MRLSNYLQEKTDINIVKVHDECSEILKMYKENNNFRLYRGVKDTSILDIDMLILREQRPDRKPMDTPQVVHDYLKKKLRQKFGWDGRTGIFATPNLDNASCYGQPWVILPFNGFKYIWSTKYADAYGTIDEAMIFSIQDKETNKKLTYGLYNTFLTVYNLAHDVNIDTPFTKYEKYGAIPFRTRTAFKDLHSLSEIIDDYIGSCKDTDLTSNHTNEVMIKSHYYYLCSLRYINVLLKEIG